MAIWNPWKGCHRKSEGCAHCYIHSADARKGIDTDCIYKTEEFYKPIEKDKKGNYKVKSGQMMFVCFGSDFLIEEADEWRKEAWEMIQTRSDLHFFFITKRIERFKVSLPDDIGEGYEHVSVCISVENQARADERIPLLKTMPIKHKLIALQPLLEPVDLSNYLDDQIDLVVAGGESGSQVRPLNYDWVLAVREQCVSHNVNFEFRQIGSYFIKDGVMQKFQRQQLTSEARKLNINYAKSSTLDTMG